MAGTIEHPHPQPFRDIGFRYPEFFRKGREKCAALEDPLQAIQPLAVKTEVGEQLVHRHQPLVMLGDFQAVAVGQIDGGVTVLFEPGGLAVMVDMAVGDHDMAEIFKVDLGPQRALPLRGGRPGIEKHQFVRQPAAIAVHRTDNIGGVDGVLSQAGHGGEEVNSGQGMQDAGGRHRWRPPAVSRGTELNSVPGC